MKGNLGKFSTQCLPVFKQVKMKVLGYRRGENWVWQEIKKEEEEERLASLTQGGILHFRNKEGVFKVTGNISSRLLSYISK